MKNRKILCGIFITLFLTSSAAFFTFTCRGSAGEPRKSEKEESRDDKKTVNADLPMRGLYFPVTRASGPAYLKKIMEKGAPLGINMMVIDVHGGSLEPRIDRNTIKFLTGSGVYLAARIVCFPDGLGVLPVPKKRIDDIYRLVEASAAAGFNEVQLDYIRFKDTDGNYSLEAKYKFIGGLLSGIREVANKNKVKLSADLFGRIVFNKNDNIGQQLELFAAHMDVVYPMLYPSHFLDNQYWMSHPGETIKEGVTRGLTRLKDTKVAVHPYIQSFKYNIQWAGVSLEKYVELQILASEATGARGWVAWNAGGEYDAVFEALKKIMGRK